MRTDCRYTLGKKDFSLSLFGQRHLRIDPSWNDALILEIDLERWWSRKLQDFLIGSHRNNAFPTHRQGFRDQSIRRLRRVRRQNGAAVKDDVHSSYSPPRRGGVAARLIRK